MKCTRCGSPDAEVSLPSHNAGFCRNCFFVYLPRQVERAIHHFHMFEPSERILVCISGGKDSLVLWDLLLSLGYSADGLHIDQGIDDYSRISRLKAEGFAASTGRQLHLIELEREGLAIPEVTHQLRQKPCSLCGVVKRHEFNAVASRLGYDVVATGHNLDDEASRLLGNLLQWNRDFIDRQYPVLQSTESGMVRKVKPLVRVTEYETTCYALLKGIDYMLLECPYSKGANSLVYKEVLNALEERIPSTKSRFLFGFLEHQREAIERRASDAGEEARNRCVRCGQPSFRELCRYCMIKEQMAR
jgi:tRNA-5-methyluridine54 2-sulfurtransferase